MKRGCVVNDDQQVNASSPVSVIIPTHNREHTLRRALDSVLAQTRPPAEVIVVDDGSVDGTSRLVADGYPAVRYLHQAHAGVSAARNRGIATARGQWLALLDSDDEWLPHKLEAQLDLVDRCPGHRLVHGNEIWIRRGRRVNPMIKHAKSGGWIYEKCLPRCVISPSAVMVHRTLFDDVGVFDETLPVCEDYDLWLRICALHPVLYVDGPVIVKYGGHDDQLSARYRGMDRFRIQALVNMLESNGLTASQRQATTQTLAEKIGIYMNGARKRDRYDEVAFCQALLVRWGLQDWVDVKQ